MKKIISTLLLTIFLISAFSIASFAEVTDTDPSDWREKAAEFFQKRHDKKEMRAELKEMADKFKENKNENKELRANNRSLFAEIGKALLQLKKSEIDIDASAKEQLKALKSSLLEKYTELKIMRGQIKIISSGLHDFIKNKDEAAIKEIFTEIKEVQLYRNTLLEEIKNILTNITDLAD